MTPIISGVVSWLKTKFPSSKAFPAVVHARHHGLERIISVTAAAHAAARRVMEKAGLTYQGTRHWMSPDVPVVWYSIDRATWKARTTP
jgi:RimJ/RimL family protein N-acetyltransferase